PVAALLDHLEESIVLQEIEPPPRGRVGHAKKQAGRATTQKKWVGAGVSLQFSTQRGQEPDFGNAVSFCAGRWVFATCLFQGATNRPGASRPLHLAPPKPEVNPTIFEWFCSNEWEGEPMPLLNQRAKFAGISVRQMRHRFEMAGQREKLEMSLPRP